ncbi:MAG: MgtC/SapB family protein [Cypionkella sp.]|jgi:putative Mg2+ transporter-C (MgtC) family protein|nr:MgtC/SapB family protein [Cypionkella sp.]
MTFDSLFQTLAAPTLMLPLLGSLVTGALIGAEREVQGKPAGLRTHTLVCFGSALMMLIAAQQGAWDARFLPDTQIVTDMSRMPHAILTGIGFLGAGVIFREGLAVQGLTTAASLWVTASLGIVYGAGMLELALIGTLIVLAVLVVLRLMQGILPVHAPLRLTLVADTGYTAADLIQTLRDQGLRPGPLSLSQTAGGLRLGTTISGGRAQNGLDALCAALCRNPKVRDVSFTPMD